MMKEYTEFKACKTCPVLDVMPCPIAAERQENVGIYKDKRYCETKNILLKYIELKLGGIDDYKPTN